MTKRKSLASTLVLLALVAVPALAADPFTGTWKLDKENTTQTIEADANGMKLARDIVLPAGQKVHQQFSLNFDGKDVPVTLTLDGKPFPIAPLTTISAKRVDNYRIEFVRKENGQEVERSSFTISQDGKSLTMTLESTNSLSGPPSKKVFQKQ